MTREKDRIEARRGALVKTARTLIRLKHSLAADAELNAALPKLEATFYATVNAGTLPDEADVAAMAKQVVGG